MSAAPNPTLTRAELVAKLKAAKEPSRTLDEDIARYLGWRELRHDDGSFHCWEHDDANGVTRGAFETFMPYWTASVDHALTFLPKGAWYMLGKGKARKSEPLYGAVLYKPDLKRNAEIGKGETDCSLAAAIVLACLDAKAMP